MAERQKFIQIACNGGDEVTPAALYALAADGTVWYHTSRYNKDTHETACGWVPVADEMVQP